MTDPTLQSRLEDALRDCDAQRAELVRLREDLRKVTAERNCLRVDLAEANRRREYAEGMQRVHLSELNRVAGEQSKTADELRMEHELRTDAEGMVKVQCDELNKLNAELRTLRNCRTVGDELGLKHNHWPAYRTEPTKLTEGP